MIIKNFKLYTDKEDAEKYPTCYVLIADFKERKITTNCGDYYYDYEFSFDDFIKFAKAVEEQDKIYNKGKK